MHFTANACYTNSDWDSTVYACQVKNFDLDFIRNIMAKASELKSTVTSFSAIIVDYPAWDVDFITSFNDQETENLICGEYNTVPATVHATPISRDLYDYENTRHCSIHVTSDSFYFKAFEKHTGNAMESDWITLMDLTG
jgi:hypothetical protein